MSKKNKKNQNNESKEVLQDEVQPNEALNSEPQEQDTPEVDDKEKKIAENYQKSIN